MSSEHAADRPRDRTTSWDALTSYLEAFLQAWDAGGTVPSVEKFLPPVGDPQRRLVLTELVKVDLEQRWIGGRDRLPLEAYLHKYPELNGPDGPPCDLIYEEYHLRKLAGEPILPEDCYRRFPGRRQELQRLIGTDAPFRTTSLSAEVRIDRIEPGQHLDEFEVIGRLGEGGFAQVFLALQRSMGRLVALKVSADRGSEPQTLAQLDHPNIVRVYDQRQIADRRMRLLYMQFLPGGTLQSVISRARSLPPRERDGAAFLESVDRALARREEIKPAHSATRESLASMGWPEVVCWVGARLAEALHYAHSRGVFHRDVKPANVLLDAEGNPKLVDFNVSFASKVEGADPRSFFGGSLAYMSPEQMEAFDPAHDRSPGSLDGRTDIYSLGMMLWEMLTGERPIRDDFLLDGWAGSLARLVEVRRSGIDEEVMAELPPDCPAVLVRILRKCLAADPEDRFPDGASLARQLDSVLNAEARQLLDPTEDGWRARAVRHSLTAAVLAGLIPNLITAVFNLVYNAEEIVENLTESGKAAFWTVQAIVNGVAFPAGIGVLIFRFLPVRRAIQGTGPKAPARARALRLGRDISLISLTGWLTAGVVYPLTLHLTSEGLSAASIVHFVVSLALCGLMAVAYSFFCMTFLMADALYPALLRDQNPGEEEGRELARLSKATWLYLLLAAAVPMLSIAALVMIQSGSRLALFGLSVGGAMALGQAFWMCRRIQDDIKALGDVFH